MFNEVGYHLQRPVHLNIRKTSPQTGKLLLFYRYLVIYKGDFSIDCLIFQGSKLFNIPFFNISADRALIVDIIFNRADSELVILAEKKGNRNTKCKIHSQGREPVVSLHTTELPPRA